MAKEIIQLSVVLVYAVAATDKLADDEFMPCLKAKHSRTSNWENLFISTYKKSNEPVYESLVFTNPDKLVPRRGPADWTRAANYQLQQQDDDDQARDPQQSNGAFVAEFVVHGVAEVGEVQQDEQHHQNNLDVELMCRAERRHGWSAAGHLTDQEAPAAITVFIVVFELVVAFVVFFVV